ncbi:unnamed protein product [Urochloa decumbens]|uniref:Scarecrow-like protein 6 n=1 Tax=Urochloa decumbens TaxID=240449 RepID=A0ABC8XAW5_9POAL
MRGMPFAGSAREGHAGNTLLLLQQQQGLAAGKLSVAGGLWEPTSVLDQRHSPSPSPPNSASTLSSPLGAATAGVAALAGANAKNVSPPPQAAGAWPGGAAGDDAAAGGGKEEWQLTPLDMSLGAGEGWDAAGAVLSDGAAPPGLAPDHTFLRWIIGGEDASAAMGAVMDPPVLELDHASSMMPPAFGPSMAFAPAMEDTKAAQFGHVSNLLIHHHQPHAAFFGSHPPSSFDAAAPPPPKRHHHSHTHPMSGAPAPKLPSFPGGGFAPAAMKPKAEAAAGNDEAAAAAVDQLAEAAKLAEAGDAFGAREILARLNYRLPAAPAAGTPPLLRSAFYFKEALRVALSPGAGGEPPATPAVSTPYDVVLKLGAYKAFSEVSPVLQFAHLTCVQAVLDEIGGAGRIHVIDLDIGMGEQWASLMQELAQRCPAAATLKVTALVSPASHHPLELSLIHENLAGFAAELGVFLQFAAFNIDTLDPAELVAITAGDAVAVHLPVGSAHVAAMPAVLRLVKRLGAKVVVSVDHGCDRTELPFAAHLFQAFQSCVSLLESVDAVRAPDADAVAKIERFMVQPGVEQRVVARHRAMAADKPPPPWRTVLASAGFVPVQASTFAESQAEALLKRMALMGFRVEKRGGALCLYWQRGELVSVSAWRC